MAEGTHVDAPFVPPGPVPVGRDVGLLRQMWLSMVRPIEGWPRAAFEEASYRPPIPGNLTFLTDPEAIATLLVGHAQDFSQGAMFRRIMRPVWGDGMLIAQGPAWRWQRHASAPAFRPAHMHALAPGMSRAAQAALDRWGPQARVELMEEAARITFDIILDTVLSGGEDLDRTTVRSRVNDFLSSTLQVRPSYFVAPDSWHERRRNRPAPGSVSLRADVDAMIRRRREAPPRGDLVDLLLAARDPETGEAMDDSILRDNLLGFIVAGHQTSSVALTWSIYLASADAKTGARLRAEVAEVAGDAPIGAEHVERLVFTRAVVSEALRLYPPAFQLYRVCHNATEFAGHKFRPGDKVLIPIYALHRHRRFWTDPDAFNPDRFMPGAPPIDRHLYMPFGAGPRVCLGAAFAMTELVVMLATLLRGATFTVEPGHRVWPGTALEMVPRGGLPMRVAALS